MKKRTALAFDLGGAQMKAQYDERAKRLLSHKEILARILKATVKECRSYSVKEIIGFIESDIRISMVPVRPGVDGEEWNTDRVLGLNAEDCVPGEGLVAFDLRLRVCIPASGDRIEIKLLVDLEAQKSYYLKYPIVTRGIFYGSRMLSAQLDTEFSDSDYEQLKKVYSIWICMNAPQKVGNAVVEYNIQKNEIQGHIEEPEEDYDKLSVIILCLNEEHEAEEGSLHRLLNVLFSRRISYLKKLEILENEFHIAVYQEWKEELKEMCNLGEGIEERGIRQGIEQGIEQGIRVLILDNLEEQIPGHRIIEKLQRRFELTEKQAADYYLKYAAGS